MTLKFAYVFAAFVGGLGVALGAFGTHGLRGNMEPHLMEAYQTAVQYQLIHALALIGVALTIVLLGPKPSFVISAYSFLVGIILFSGSLYVLALTDMTSLGLVTPLGGLCLIVGWLSLIIGGLRHIG